MDLFDRIDKIFGHSNYKHRTLRTLFDPGSFEYSETTMEQKIVILKKILDSGETLWMLLLEYQAFYNEINKKNVVKEVQMGLAELLQFALKPTATAGKQGIEYAANIIINDIFKKGALIAVESDVLSIYFVGR